MYGNLHNWAERKSVGWKYTALLSEMSPTWLKCHMILKGFSQLKGQDARLCYTDIVVILHKRTFFYYYHYYFIIIYIIKHICISKLTIIGLDNGLSPGRRQAIIPTNAGILLIGSLGTNFSEILIEICKFSFKKMHFKLSSEFGGHFVSASIC